MKHRLFGILLVILLAIANYQCSSFPWDDTPEPTQKSNLTAGMVKTQIIKGETIQADILKIFGAPNIITKNRSNNEVWNYNRMSFESVARSENRVSIFFIDKSKSKAMSTATTKSFDLIIIFDENDVVIDYSIISAAF